MNICVLVPSEDHMTQAGVRVRYRRIEHVLRDQGHELHVTPIQNLASQADFPHDVYIISKCYDARAFLVAHLLAGSEKRVGVDFFDDYFSQSHDSRFTGLRYWLRTLLQLADFVLCSTPAMRELAGRHAPGLPVHVMNDPAVPLDAEIVRLGVRRKLEYAKWSGILNVGWFGIGDNPHFPVGLADLVAFGEDLAKLRGQGFDVRLSILTNQRAMTTDGLAMLRRLAVPYTVEEWTEEGEKRLLARSLVCFLPVNAQNFSVVKSLNRAVSALSAGAQVLSSGYPLYDPLAPFVYRDPAKLLDDIKRHSLVLREDTVPQLMRLIEERADPVAEGRSLAKFLEKQRERASSSSPAAGRQAPAAVIHGKNTLGDAHKLAQRMAALSVCSPFCHFGLNFDLRFALAADREGFDVLIADKHCPTLGLNIQALMSPHGKILDTMYQKLDASQLFPGLRFDGTALARTGSPMSISASYPYVMANIEKILQRLFPGISCYHSEHATLPWAIPPRAEFASRKAV